MARFPLMPPPGIQMDNTTFSAEGAWWDCDKVRFWRDRPQTIGGWEPYMTTAVTGVCRNLLPWRDNAGDMLTAFGTHSNLEVFYGGELFDITPTLSLPPRVLAANPITATSGSAVFSLSMPGHGLTTGDSVVLSGATAVGTRIINGTYSVTVTDADNFTVTFGSNATTTALGANPLTTANASKTVTVTHTAHGLSSGATVNISGASAVNGVTLSGDYVISVIDDNSYTVQASTAANAAGAGGGGAVVVFAKIAGGADVLVTPQNAFAAGNINGSDGSGYGAGSYGSGLYGYPTTDTLYLRTWALANYGESLMANPRGGTIYQWENDTGTDAAPLKNAPARVTFTLVTPQRQVLAFGCNEEASGVFNPMCIRGSDIEDPENWTTSTSTNAFEQVLEGGGRLVGARLNAYGIFVWTDTSLYQATFLGDPGQTYRFDKIGSNCGLIGPNAAAVAGQVAFWLGQDRQFYSCPLGGTPTIITSPVQTDMSDNLALGQQDKVVASSVSQFGEIWWFYPDQRDTVVAGSDNINGLENSRYVSLSYVGQGWARGSLSRTAFIDASPEIAPIGVDYSGSAFYHERGQYANGSPIDWYIQSADYYLGEADRTLEIQSVWPDFEDQAGAIQMTMTTRLYPQGAEYTRGPYSLSPNRGKRDFRSSGRVVRVRIGSNAAPSYARLGKLEFDAQPRGLR